MSLDVSSNHQLQLIANAAYCGCKLSGTQFRASGAS